MNTMTEHDVQQGSDQWLELRGNRTNRNASEAPIAFGCHPKMSRDELLHAKATLSLKEFTDFVQRRVLDHGHEVEAKARILIEKTLGESLYPITGTIQIDGNTYLASYDGLTMDGSIGFEHKQWNAELAERVKAGDVPDYIYWQLEHQFIVNPDLLEITLVISDGTEENRVVHSYSPVPGRRQKLIAGWDLFMADLAAYVPTFKEAKVVGVKPADLPVPTLELSGQLATQGNIHDFDKLFRQMVGSINTDLKTDQDFADADSTVKYLKELRDKLALSKKMALGKAVPLDEAFKIIDGLDELARVTAKNLDEQIKVRKDNRKQEIANDATRRIADDMAAAQTEFKAAGINFGLVYTGKYDPYATMKGMRSFDEMAKKVNSAVAQIRLDIGTARDKVRANLKTLTEGWTGFEFLFRDKTELCAMEASILAMTIRDRIRDHKEKMAGEETARIAKHQQTLTILEAAVANSEGQPIEMLMTTRARIKSIDPATLEEFSVVAGQKKQAALTHLDAAIAKLETAAAQAKAQKEAAERAQQSAVEASLPVTKHEPEPSAESFDDDVMDIGSIHDVDAVPGSVDLIPSTGPDVATAKAMVQDVKSEIRRCLDRRTSPSRDALEAWEDRLDEAMGKL